MTLTPVRRLIFLNVRPKNIWFLFWIYKRIELLEIIKLMPDKPESNLDHFMLGCLFGYSNDSILDFINKINN